MFFVYYYFYIAHSNIVSDKKELETPDEPGRKLAAHVFKTGTLALRAMLLVTYLSLTIFYLKKQYLYIAYHYGN